MFTFISANTSMVILQMKVKLKTFNERIFR